MRKAIALLFVILTMASAAVLSLPDFAGTNTAVQLKNDSTVAFWITVISPSGNASHVRFGDSTTSASRGVDIAPGGTFTTPVCQTCRYPLSGTYIYVATGDSANVTYGN
jgi:hypothetical protein